LTAASLSAVPAPAEEAPASPAAWYALAVLALTTFLALLDRQLMLLLAEPIRIDLRLSDFQLGLLQGAGVALFAAVASFPLGWLADRYDRRIVLAGCVAFWSAAVFACGLATSFQQLLIAGALVGAGESGLAPVMYAMIPLMFMGRQRQLANSLAALATVGGGALAFLVAGQLIALVDNLRAGLPQDLAQLPAWRLAFFAAALPAPLMILLILSIRLPASRPAARPQPVGDVAETAPAGLVSARAYFARHAGTYARFYLGGALGGFAFAALAVWVAVIAGRLFGQTPAQIGAALGLAQIVSMGLGFAISVLAANRYRASAGGLLPVRLIWVGSLLAAVTCLTLLVVSTPLQLYLCYGLIGVSLSLASMVFPTALQGISPQHLRGRAASLQFIVSLSLAAAAPPLVGLLSDRLSTLPNAPLVAVVIVAAPALFLGGAMFWWCERSGLQAALADAAAIDGEARPA
jgi:MFS family permease